MNPSCGSSLKVVEDGRSPFIDEFQIYAFGIHVQVNTVIVNVFLRRDVAFDKRTPLIGRISNIAIEEDGVGTFSPIEMNVEVTHRSVIQSELGNTDVSIGLRRREQRMGISITCGFTTQFYRMEVDEREDVFQIDALQLSMQGIGL